MGFAQNYQMVLANYLHAITKDVKEYSEVQEKVNRVIDEWDNEDELQKAYQDKRLPTHTIRRLWYRLSIIKTNKK